MHIYIHTCISSYIQERFKLDADLKMTDLRMLVLLQELRLLKEFEKRDNSLVKKLDDKVQCRNLFCRADKVHTFNRLQTSAYYGVASSSRLLQIIGLFCKRALYKRRYSAKETYNFKEPTNRTHPISYVLRKRSVDL